MHPVEQLDSGRLAGAGLTKDLQERELVHLAAYQLSQETGREPTEHLGQVLVTVDPQEVVQKLGVLVLGQCRGIHQVGAGVALGAPPANEPVLCFAGRDNFRVRRPDDIEFRLVRAAGRDHKIDPFPSDGVNDGTGTVRFLSHDLDQAPNMNVGSKHFSSVVRGPSVELTA